MEQYKEYLIYKYLPTDYVDSYVREVISDTEYTAEKFFEMGFCRFPRWIEWLLHLRNAIVKPFGLDIEKRFADSIIEKTNREVIFSMDDKHLTFYTSIWCSELESGKQQVRLTTAVKIHNWLGRVYMGVIRPFHTKIVKSTLKKICKMANA